MADVAELTPVTRELTVPFTAMRADDGAEVGTDGLTLEGYAAVFNTPAPIEDFEGEYDEVMVPGAFARTLRSRKPVLMFEHGRHPLIGPMPLGTFTELREDSRGLFVRARLNDSWLIAPVRDAIAAGAVDGMSIRFEIPDGKAAWTRNRDGRRLHTVREVKLYELGPVVFPAYVETTAMVRSLRAAAPTVFERTEDLAPGDEPEGADENTGTTELPADDGTSEVPAEESNGDSAERSHSPDPMSHAERKHYVRQLVARDLRAER